MATGVVLAATGLWLLARSRPLHSPGTPLLVALIADAHLVGPQYVCCSESNDVDNDSIMKTGDRLRAAQQQIESLSPRPNAVIFLGDVIHNGYYSQEFDWYLSHRNAYTVGGEVFGNFSTPVHYLWGNHDYKTTCGNTTASYDRSRLSHRLFRHFLGPSAAPYSAVQAGRYSLLLLNAQLGPSWDPDHPRCDVRQASLGKEQLRWLQRQLRSGRPTFVFIHYPVPAAMRDEVPELAPHPDLLSTLLAYRNDVMAVFSGHYHRGLDWGAAYPFRALTLPAVRYDEDNFFLLSLPQHGPVRSWQLLDWDKNKGGARCSDSWSYPPGAVPRPPPEAAPETGSCGRPTTSEVGDVDLQPLQRPEDVPGPPGQPQFNPEPACCLQYQRQFLDLCVREGASALCCSILGEHLRPSSAAYGASCLCWPPFWRHAQATFAAGNLSAEAVLQACATLHGTRLQWAGRAGGSCLEPGSDRLPPAA